MLLYFNRINFSIYSVILFNLLAFTYAHKSHAQSLGDPIVHITFGSGINQYSPALAPDSGYTNYGYVGFSPEDNFYTIANSTEGMNNGWVRTTDHTGDLGGYMMIVNASKDPGLFYTRTVTNLCGSTTYQFAAWIKNLIKPTDLKAIKPNVTFSIATIDGRTLGVGTTGDIAANDEWVQYPLTFTTPVNTQTVVIKMVNYAPGGGGNDLAIDDITFSPYSETSFNIQFYQSSATACEGSPQTINILSTTQLEGSFAQKLQQMVNGVWIDKSPASTNASFAFSSPTEAGIYSYRLVKSDAGNINTSNCVIASNIINVTVLPLPLAAISVADNTCQGDPTFFKDASSTAGSTATGALITSWLWDFGDGQTSTEQDPSHLYAAPGNYTVRLTVTNATGCTSVSTTKSVHVTPKANVDFNYTVFDCATRSVTFSDISTVSEGSITLRLWDFGDNSTVETKMDNTPFQHIYTASGSYTVKLTITNDKGCLTTLIKTINVAILPVVDFTLPEVCYADINAKFTDATTIPGDGMSGFTYSWNFGDADANAGNPNTSTLQNPQHYFGKAQQYQVALTVKTSQGCTVTTIKTLQVNGSPIPDFKVLDENSLCTNREVFFVNKATATVGKITKLIMYFDTNDLSIQEIDNDPYPDKVYRHTYPNGGKSYTVRMEAFTGDANVCQMFKDHTISLLPAPQLTFAPPGSVCLNGGPMTLTSTENTGSAGVATYSGTGVNGNVFAPADAGVGTFSIRCIYTSVNGCADTISKNITVKPIPTVDAGPDATILVGGSTILHAVASGDNITYSWSPATGLSNTKIADPVVTSDKDITYTLTVTNAEGCIVTDSVHVKIVLLPVIPNAFTPNNDGINDTWDIKYLDSYAGCTINIFNRNGQKVYSSINYNIPWDGRYNGKDLLFGVYYYIIDPKNGRKPLSGYVTIIR
jgi:gliding motility-associated-like protein